jgi:hypothetical protein
MPLAKIVVHNRRERAAPPIVRAVRPFSHERAHTQSKSRAGEESGASPRSRLPRERYRSAFTPVATFRSRSQTGLFERAEWSEAGRQPLERQPDSALSAEFGLA